LRAAADYADMSEHPLSWLRAYYRPLALTERWYACSRDERIAWLRDAVLADPPIAIIGDVLDAIGTAGHWDAVLAWLDADRHAAARDAYRAA